jgi:hypothetical protein
MARVDLAYARGLWRAAPTADLVRLVVKRARAQLRATPRPRPPDGDAVRAAVAALDRAPRVLAPAPLDDAYRACFPDAPARFAARAARILAHEIDVFGVPCALGPRIDWRRDPLTGGRLDGDARELFPDGADPKGAWELARAGHLVELAAAARLVPALVAPARAELEAEIGSFLDDNPLGRGVHYASPLEVALRAIHWLGAVELVGGARALSPPFVARLAAALLGDAQFLATHLEDTGVVPANHLLGNYIGLWVLGLALDGAPGAQKWQTLAARGLAVEAHRQVGSDGAHFEASTAYHRFALELLLVAHLHARAADRPSPVAETLHRMLEYLRHTLGPDGCEPAFGDSDDARLYPIVPRPPRQHAYLLPVGAALFGDPALRPPDGEFSEEALWLCGPVAADVWRWLPSTAPLPSASFPSGGVHVVRSEHWQVALRSGSYGQNGVGGHAHNDQLSLVAWLDGAPLVVDPGTARYAADLVARNRFRGTAAHSTIVVDGAEQSPILDGRPFALLDRARAPRVRLEDTGAVAVVTGAHEGYRRLRARLRHHRRLTLRRDLDAVVIDDRLDGRGDGAVELRLHLGQPARRGAPAGARRRLDEVARALGLGPIDSARAIAIGDPARAIVYIVGIAGRPNLESGQFSPRYGMTEPIALVTFRARLIFPADLKTVLVRVDQTAEPW